MMRMQLYLCFHSLLGILVLCSLLSGILCSPEHYINWSEASKQCKTRYESELITEGYVAEQNLTAEIIQELGVNVSAWIDGKVQEIGCRNDVCLRIKKIHTKLDIKNQYLCVTPDDIDIKKTNVSYKEAEQWCLYEKFEIKGELYKSILLDKVEELSHTSVTRISFWVPNIELSSEQDVNCTHVVSRDNKTLETLYDDCTIPMMGVCINTSYIPDYQMSVVLEITPINIPVSEIDNGKQEIEEENDYSKAQALQVIGTKDEVHIQDLTKNNDSWDLKTVLPFATSGFNLILFLTLACVVMVLWKRVTSNWKFLAKKKNPYDLYNPEKPRKRNRDYQGLPVIASGNSTRVKMLPEVEENPYAEINGKEGSCFSRETATSALQGYVDMRGLKRGEPCSSFKIGKNSRRQLNSGYAESGEIV